MCSVGALATSRGMLALISFPPLGPTKAAATRYGMVPLKYCHFVRNFLKSGQGESHGPT